MSEANDPLQEGAEAAPAGVRVMAVLRWGLVAAMAALAVGSAIHFGFDGAGVPAARAVKFQCPMHPAIVQDRPGSCPICGMDLVPRSETPPADHRELDPELGAMPSVDLSPDRIQLIGMRTATVTRGSVGGDLVAVGYVSASELGEARVHTRFAGWIETLPVGQTGEQVRAGQVLATIYSPELLTAQQELLSALRWERESNGGAVSPAGMPLARDARRRLELLGIAPQDVAQIEAAKEPLRALPIRSPTRGHVIKKNAVLGAYVRPDQELFEIADLSTVWVIGEVYEHDLPHVALGQPARFELTALPGSSFAGRVTLLYPSVDPQSRSLRFRVELPNPKLRLRPGMFGDLVLELPAREVLLVPTEAVIDAGQHSFVFVALDGGRFTPRRVRTGARAAERVEVLAGLEAGEQVVTTGNFLLESESRVRGAIDRER